MKTVILMYQVISSKNCCVLASLRLRSNSGKVPFFLVLFFGQTKKTNKETRGYDCSQTLFQKFKNNSLLLF
jgi:hypothetical protein